MRRRHRARRDDIGDLVTRRPLPNEDLDQLDPFLFLNHHGPQVYPPHNHGLPFGPHPHRGFETVTFILAGSLVHRDTAGHESVIHAGGVQWMTAGRGLEHAELSPPDFLERGGPLEILQLWVNLPSRLKMTEPRYIGLQRDQIPSIREGDATINFISGPQGPIESLTGVVMTTVDVNGRVTLPAPRGRTVFLYDVNAFELIEWNDDGDTIEVESGKYLFGHAEPLREPVVAHGPFVMNTREEILQAIRDYQAGKFG